MFPARAFSRWGTRPVLARRGAAGTRRARVARARRSSVWGFLGTPRTSTSPGTWRGRACRCTRAAPTRLAPEIAHFPDANLGASGRVGQKREKVHALGDDVLVKAKDAHHVLRPETAESLYVLWRVTGEEEWRDAGWDVWRAWGNHARVDTGGYAGLDNVTQDAESEGRVDKMESFWLGETLKYLYLLFSDDPALLPPECFVFNTEAHLLPVVASDGVPDTEACVELVAEAKRREDRESARAAVRDPEGKTRAKSEESATERATPSYRTGTLVDRSYDIPRGIIQNTDHSSRSSFVAAANAASLASFASFAALASAASSAFLAALLRSSCRFVISSIHFTSRCTAARFIRARSASFCCFSA